MLLKNDNVGSEFLKSINALGCGLEGGAFEGYFSINVPESVDIENCYALIDTAEDSEYLVADYPSIRH